MTNPSKRKSMLSIIMLSFLLLTLIALPATAGSLSRTYSGQFTSPWAKTAKVGPATLEYGFNTFLINEDTAYANHTGSVHNAKIINGAGTHRARSRAAGYRSILEVQHSGSKVTYVCEW